jgi:hypothetical protein
VVGAGIGADQELGFLRGDGDLSDDGRLTLTTMDPRAVPAGRRLRAHLGLAGRPAVCLRRADRHVQSVEASPRDQTATAVIAPSVDFSSLDLVQVVVGAAPTIDLARTPAGD